jgi:hypothetical protein
MERLIKKIIIWYFLRKRNTAVFEIDDKFVVRIFSKDFYNNDVIEALREYQWKRSDNNAE